MTARAGILAVSGADSREAMARIAAAVELLPWRGVHGETIETDTWCVAGTGAAQVAHGQGVVVLLHPSPSGPNVDELHRAVVAGGVAEIESVRSPHACAIIDSRTNEAHLSRDFMGSRPLYWGRHGHELAIGSDPLAVQLLLGLDPTPNETNVHSFLNRVPQTVYDTFYEGVSSVAPDTVLTVGRQTVERVRRFDALPPVDDDTANSRVRSALLTAVERGVAQAETVACNASGGLDSAVVAASAAVLDRCDAFITHRVLDLEDDETERAAELAQMHQVHHEVIRLNPSDTVSHITKNIRAIGPVHATAWLSGATVERAAQLSADVILPGHPGDYWLTMASGSLGQSLRDHDPRAAWKFLREYRNDSEASLVRTAGMAIKQTARGLLIGPYANYCRELFRCDAPLQLTIQSLERFGALFDVAVELPLADRDYVEAVLGSTAMQRNQPGRPKAILRDAFVDDLPASFIEDPIKANFFRVPTLALNDGHEGADAYTRVKELFVEAWRDDLRELSGVVT